jgi:hypothetical protein
MTYGGVDKSSSPRGKIGFLHDMHIRQRLHHVEERHFGFEEVCSHVGEQLAMMGVEEKVVMSNAAAMRRLYTHGNNEALCRRIFPTPTPIVLRTRADDWGQSLFQ